MSADYLIDIENAFKTYKSSQSPWIGPVERKGDPIYLKLRLTPTQIDNEFIKDLNNYQFWKVLIYRFLKDLNNYHSINSWEELYNMELDMLFTEGIHKSFYSSDSITVYGMDSFKDILKNSPKEYLFISPEFASVINNDIIYSPIDKHIVNTLMDKVGVWQSKNIVIFHGIRHDKCYLLPTSTICDINEYDYFDNSINMWVNKNLEGFVLEGIDIPIFN